MLADIVAATKKLKQYYAREGFVSLRNSDLMILDLDKGAFRLLLLAESVNGTCEAISRGHCASCAASGFEMRCYGPYIKGRHFGFACASRRLLPC
jgi:hypothetical protein